MSNINIINRLRQKFLDYRSNQTSQQDFANFILDSVDALENKDDSVIEKARDFEYRFTNSLFFDEYPDTEDPQKVSTDFDTWLDELSEIYR